MSNGHSLLIVEDEAAIRTGLIDVFVYHGYQVDFAEDGKVGLEKALSGQYDLILLDVMLPYKDGFEICSNIREQDAAQPIIMLTAKSSDEDIINGLTLGADDYIAKPFSVAQLVLRVKAVLRRAKRQLIETSHIKLAVDRVIDLENLRILINNSPLPFTKREVEVIEYLHQNNQRPVTREELLEKVWGYDNEMAIETRTVDIHIARIRRKIEADAKNPQFLLTIRGAGYRLISQEEQNNQQTLITT